MFGDPSSTMLGGAQGLLNLLQTLALAYFAFVTWRSGAGRLAVVFLVAVVVEAALTGLEVLMGWGGRAVCLQQRSGSDLDDAERREYDGGDDPDGGAAGGGRCVFAVGLAGQKEVPTGLKLAGTATLGERLLLHTGAGLWGSRSPREGTTTQGPLSGPGLPFQDNCT